jgi:hypothetical protein
MENIQTTLVLKLCISSSLIIWCHPIPSHTMIADSSLSFSNKQCERWRDSLQACTGDGMALLASHKAAPLLLNHDEI